MSTQIDKQEFRCPECKEVVNAPNVYGMCKCFACHIAFEAFNEEDTED